MIRSVTGGQHLYVSGGTPLSTYVNTYNTGLYGVGNMRYNSTLQNIEVFDGNNWVALQTGSATISLAPAANDAIEWAIKKMREERELEELAKQYSAVADAKQQLDVIVALVREHKSNQAQS